MTIQVQQQVRVIPEDEYLSLIKLAKKYKNISNRFIKFQRQYNEPEIFSVGEIKQIIKTIENSKSYRNDAWGFFQRLRDILKIRMGYNLALRPSESRQLMISDIKESPDGAILFIRPETNKERTIRKIIIPKKLFVAIKIYLNFNHDYFWRGNPYLFPAMNGGCMSASTCRHKFNAILKEAGIYDGRKNQYSLRHSRACHLLDSGMTTRELKRYFNHRSIESTEKYEHMTKKSKNRIKKIVNIKTI